MSPTQQEPDDRLVGGRYRLQRPLGRGGMGVVWAARDELLHRDVAVKEVTPPPGLDAGQRRQLRERTLREARAAARIASSAAVTVYDVVEEDDRPWIVMELLPARSLADVLRETGPLAPAAAAALGLRLLDALDAAHAAGVTHRDVKPANVLYDGSGEAVLTDFGIASLEGDTSLTTTGAVVGSPGYVAPERAHGQPATPAADMWSLGVTLAAAVHGRSPFERDTPLATLVAALNDPLPEHVRTGPLARVVERLLDRDPATRADAAEARRLLRATAADPGTAVGSTTVLPPVARGSAGDPERTQALRLPPRAGQARPARPVRPAGAPARPAGAPARPAGAPVRPAGAPVRPAGAPVRPAGAPARPAGAPARPAGAAARPAGAPVPAARPATRSGTPRGAGANRGRLLPVLVAVAVLVVAVAVLALQLDRGPGATAAPGAPSADASTAPAGSAPPGAADEGAGDEGAGDEAATGAPPDPQGAAAREDAPGQDEAGEDEAREDEAAEDAEARADEADEAAEDAEDASDEQGSEGAAGGGPGTAPAGFRLHSDPAYRVAVPEGWTVEEESDIRTRFLDPSSRRFLLVEEGGEPAGDPVEDWQAQEPVVADRLDGYELIGIERADFRDFDAADWQFRWEPEGGEVRVLNRAAVDTDIDQAYALYWSVPVEEWDASRDLFADIAASFQPVGDD